MLILMLITFLLGIMAGVAIGASTGLRQLSRAERHARKRAIRDDRR